MNQALQNNGPEQLRLWSEKTLQEPFSIFGVTNCECGKIQILFNLYDTGGCPKLSQACYLIYIIKDENSPKPKESYRYAIPIWNFPWKLEDHMNHHLNRFKQMTKNKVALKLDTDGGTLGTPEETEKAWNDWVYGKH